MYGFRGGGVVWIFFEKLRFVLFCLVIIYYCNNVCDLYIGNNEIVDKNDNLLLNIKCILGFFIYVLFRKKVWKKFLRGFMF